MMPIPNISICISHIPTSLAQNSPNGHLDVKFRDDVLHMLSTAVGMINTSDVLHLERDTWGHGDFKPENVLLDDRDGIYFIDNDLHKKPAVVDVGKLISRSIALCFDGTYNPARMTEQISEFIAGYSNDWAFPPYLPEIIAMDMIAILASYSTIHPDLLDQSPHLAQVFLKKPRQITDFVGFLTTKGHHNINSIVEFFN